LGDAVAERMSPVEPDLLAGLATVPANRLHAVVVDHPSTPLLAA
jgi:hypothetical protein